MDQEIRNKLRNVVTQCRKLLEDSISQELEGKYGIFAKKDQITADPNVKMTHLTEEEQAARKDILDHFGHISARGFKPKDSLDQLVREIAFTHLNRLCAYKMMEAREVYVGGQKFRETVSRGVNSNGVKFYLAEHEEDERLFNTGHQDVAYRHYLDWLGGALSDEIGVLFNPNDPANRLYPRQKTLDEVLELLNEGGIKAEETELREQWPQIWSQDETIGWVYQYFTPKELRDQARKESSAPRNSYELAFRNQFFTPRYVVEFLTDNTLGRIWYEMRKGETKLKDQCRYMVRRPTEMFLREGEQPPKDASEGRDDLSQEEMLKLPVHIPHRPKKDPRELKILDPACGSGHFLLYCFDLLLTIYEEAYADPDLGPALKKDYPTLDALKRDVPRLILANNLHGIDIDLRASQIAALALWLRCQRAYQDMGFKKDRPKITRSNFVCAEPMPGEAQMLKEFVGQLEPKVLGQVVEVVFDRMKLAGEAGSLLKIEEEIRDAIREAKRQFAIGGISIQRTLFDKPSEPVVKVFSVKDITDAQFFEGAEAQVIEALRSYAEKAQNGQRLQRRLFSEDAVRGFAFVDLCQKRYDVVLMNPPFGQSAIPARSYLENAYSAKRQDLAASFIARWHSLTLDGCLGCIVTRSIFFLSSYTNWRKAFAAGEAGVRVLADLGQGVLDTAMVEACAAVFGGNAQSAPSLFLDVREDVDKQPVLERKSALPTEACGLDRIYSAPLQSFTDIPTVAFCYWVSCSTRSAFRRLSSFLADGNEAWVGLQTNDDCRWIRLWTEVPMNCHGRERSNELRRSWVPYSKGGAFSNFYGDLHLVIDWTRDGQTIKVWKEEQVGLGLITRNNSKCWNETKYFRSGVTWTQRSQIGLGVRALPSGTIFGIKGPAAFAGRHLNNETLLAVMNSTVFRGLVALHMAFGSYDTGVMQRTPIPKLTNEQKHELGVLARDIVTNMAALDEANELSHRFLCVNTTASSIADCSRVLAEQQQCMHAENLSKQKRIDLIVANAYGLSECEIESLQRQIVSLDDDESGEVNEEEEADVTTSLASDLLSYGIGVVFGRWDCRLALGQKVSTPFGDPFAPLPLAAPGSLPCKNGSVVAEIPEDYPILIDSDGVAVDDPDHPDDIVLNVRRVLEVLWNDRADSIEEEVCNMLGAKDLRDYFRKPGKGGFWDDHISRYSKSRRKAPIYWLLQSSKKNYAIWLYYHRLDKDLLFKALKNYVEPKIRLEEDCLKTLRAQKATAGESGKEAKRLAKDMERQEDFLSELRDFEDKLRRAANLHLEPDLNDGVVLNIAPLWELVPWKEAKKYWDELLESQYEWSSIGKQLRQKGLVK